MNTLDVIKNRRSVRKYLNKKISDEQIRELIDCARHAPFGGPLKKEPQLWEYIIVQKKEIKKELALGYSDRQFIINSSVIIAICADKEKDQKYKDWAITCSLSMENILLAAHDMGLGACIVSAFTHNESHLEDRKKLAKILQLPENIELISLISVGHPDPTEEIAKKELREIDEIAHFDRW